MATLSQQPAVSEEGAVSSTTLSSAVNRFAYSLVMNNDEDEEEQGPNKNFGEPVSDCAVLLVIVLC